MGRQWAMDEIVETLGFEHPMTIWFLQICEDSPNAEDDKIIGLLNAALDLVRLAREVEEEGQ